MDTIFTLSNSFKYRPRPKFMVNILSNLWCTMRYRPYLMGTTIPILWIFCQYIVDIPDMIYSILSISDTINQWLTLTPIIIFETLILAPSILEVLQPVLDKLSARWLPLQYNLWSASMFHQSLPTWEAVGLPVTNIHKRGGKKRFPT